MRSVTILAAVLCSTVLVFGTTESYAEGSCGVVCKDEAVASLAAADTSACQAECNAFCVTQAPPSTVFSCFFKDVNVKGQCDVVCKDTANASLAAADTIDCQTTCNVFCQDQIPASTVLSCLFKAANVKGNCDVLCKDESSDHIMLPNTQHPEVTEAACIAECDAFCGAAEEVKECLFKGVTIEGNCDVTCKDDAVRHAWTLDAPACGTDCNQFCDAQSPASTVLSCLFKGANVKGNCDVECKDGTSYHDVLVDPNATENDCRSDCNTFCGTSNDVLSCLFKGQNLIGNCDVECKSGESDHITLLDPDANDAECVNQCDAYCDTRNNVLSCRFKGQNLLGNCDIECKDGESDHIIFEGAAGNKDACLSECNAFCRTSNDVLSCLFKGQNVLGNCDVECKSGESDHITLLDPDANEDACVGACDTYCTTNANVLSCIFKRYELAGASASGIGDGEDLVEGQLTANPKDCPNGATELWFYNWNNDRQIDGWELHVTGFKEMTGDFHDGRYIDGHAWDKLIPQDCTVKVDAKHWVDGWNSMGWKEPAAWECVPGGAHAQVTQVQAVPGHYWRFDYPENMGGGLLRHRFTIVNDDSDDAITVTGLTLLPSPVPIAHAHLDEIDLSGGVGPYSFNLLTEGAAWSTDTIVTTDAFVGGYIYFGYEVREYPGGAFVAQGYGGHPITEAQCAVTCKDGTVQETDVSDAEQCGAECAGFCGTLDEVARCNFKGELIATKVPAVTEWGMAVMVLLVVAAGTVVIRRARAVRA